MKMLVRWDMRLTDREVLRVIAMSDSCTQSALAARLECHEMTVHRAIKRLIAKGHLTIVGGGRRIPYQYQINTDKLPDDLKRELLAYA